MTPFRKRGAASVDELNNRLWEIVNPKADGKKEIQSGRRTYRMGDRIIHNKNKNQISNGDIGYVKDIYVDEEGVQLAKIEFSEGRIGNSSAMSKYTNFECKFICVRKIFVYFEYGVLPKARFLAAYAAKKAVKQPNRACMAELLLIS